MPLPAAPQIMLPDSMGESVNICSGTTGWSVYDANAGSTLSSYQWYSVPQGAGISGANLPYASFDFGSTAYTAVALTVVDSNGCSNNASLNIDIGNSTAVNPQIILTQPDNILVVLDNQADSYQWGYDLEPDLIPTLPSPDSARGQDWDLGAQFDTVNKHYWVIVSEGGCWNKIYYNRSPETGVADKGEAGYLSVYPNPAQDELHLNFGEWNAANISLKLFDVTGRQLKSWSAGDAEKQVWDVSGLVPAIIY